MPSLKCFCEPLGQSYQSCNIIQNLHHSSPAWWRTDPAWAIWIVSCSLVGSRQSVGTSPANRRLLSHELLLTKQQLNCGGPPHAAQPPRRLHAHLHAFLHVTIPCQFPATDRPSIVAFNHFRMSHFDDVTAAKIWAASSPLFCHSDVLQSAVQITHYSFIHTIQSPPVRHSPTWMTR